jgi:1,4-dihydroxy-6-naphthoate synthase
MNDKKLSLGFSSCPNDAFIFEAIVNRRIDLQGLEFEFRIADVEELNRAAFAGEPDITKVSFAAFLNLAKDYFLLDAGAALGERCGPLLVTKREYAPGDLPGLRIAIPGKNTTANLLLSLLFPAAVNKTEMIFSAIEDAVLEDRVDVGLIIHESRFTYAAKGLHKLADVGDLWESRTGTLVPLGGIIMKRSLPKEIQAKVNQILRASVEFAFANPRVGWEFIKTHAQSTADDVIQQHIDLYVNKHSVDLGQEGRKSVLRLMQEAKGAGLLDQFDDNLFFKG